VTVDEPAITISDTTQKELIEITRSPIPYQPSRKRDFDLLHTRLELSFDWERQHVLGQASLQFTPYFYTKSTLIIDAKGFEIHSLAKIEESDTIPLAYEYDSLQLKITLDREYRRGESFWVYVDYTAMPENIKGFGSEAIQGEKGLYFINPDSTQDKPQQIWTQGETTFSSCWFPTIDAPNERSTQETFLTVPDYFQTLSNGKLVWSRGAGDGFRTDYWSMEQPHAPYLFMLAVGQWAVVEEEWRGKSVQYWVEPEYEEHAKAIFGHTPEMMTFFSERLGVEFPWDKYAQIVVRDFVSGAMENTTASVFMESLHRDSRALLDEHWDGIIAHELFHQWFGDYVTCESWANLTLNEAFADYSEYLWTEYKYGRDSADYIALESMFDYLEEANEAPKELIRYYHADPGEMFDRHSYNKGGRVLHMLRRYVGDEAFFAALQEYLTTNALQSVEVHNLRMAFEKVTGEDLNWFFDQWFLLPGHPTLQVEHMYNDSTQTLSLLVTQAQNLDEFPLFELPLNVDVYVKGKPTRHSIRITEARQEFQWQTEHVPDLVLVDPDRQLLGVILHEKPLEMLAAQAELSGHFYYRLVGLSQWVELSKDSIQVQNMARKFLSDSFWLNRMVGLSAFEGYVGTDKASVVSSLRAMAMTDPVPTVRAEALSVLSTIESGLQLTDVYTAMKDSAYSVVGNAISLLPEQGLSDQAMATAIETYEPYRDIQVVLPLADLLVGLQSEKKLPWFITKFHDLQGADRYYFVAYMSEYMLLLPEKDRAQGMEALWEVAQNDHNYYVRAASVNALQMLDIKGQWENRVQAIMDDETDPRFFDFFGATVIGGGE